MGKGEKFLGVVCGAIQLVCIGGLASIALKRNDACYKAECKLAEKKFELAAEQIDNSINRMKIRKLEREIEELKAKETKEES